jgi:hypothetical protein
MEISHMISDGILTITGLYVFFRYLLKLNLTHTILWESFILSITCAALFGSLRYAGFQIAANASTFFQHLAITVGAVGIIAASWALVTNISLDKTTCYILLTVGFLIFAVSDGFNIPKILDYTPLVSIPLVGLAGIYGLFKGRIKAGAWLIGGVLCMALATLCGRYIENPALSIDVYHYLVALGLLSFGLATQFHLKSRY